LCKRRVCSCASAASVLVSYMKWATCLVASVSVARVLDVLRFYSTSRLCAASWQPWQLQSTLARARHTYRKAVPVRSSSDYGFTSENRKLHVLYGFTHNTAGRSIMYSTWPYFTLRLTYGRNLPPRIWHRARLCSVPPVPDRKDADDRSTVDETGRARGLPYGRFLARGLHYPSARAIDSRSVEYINCNFFHVPMLDVFSRNEKVRSTCCV